MVYHRQALARLRLDRFGNVIGFADDPEPEYHFVKGSQLPEIVHRPQEEPLRQRVLTRAEISRVAPGGATRGYQHKKKPTTK